MKKLIVLLLFSDSDKALFHTFDEITQAFPKFGLVKNNSLFHLVLKLGLYLLPNESIQSSSAYKIKQSFIFLIDL